MNPFLVWTPEYKETCTGLICEQLMWERNPPSDMVQCCQTPSGPVRHFLHFRYIYIYMYMYYIYMYYIYVLYVCICIIFRCIEFPVNLNRTQCSCKKTSKHFHLNGKNFKTISKETVCLREVAELLHGNRTLWPSKTGQSSSLSSWRWTNEMWIWSDMFSVAHHHNIWPHLSWCFALKQTRLSDENNFNLAQRLESSLLLKQCLSSWS